MTKKDYELIAGSIWRSEMALERNEGNKIKRAAMYRMRELIVIDLAASLANDNPLFDRTRFLAACGIEDLWNRRLELT